MLGRHTAHTTQNRLSCYSYIRHQQRSTVRCAAATSPSLGVLQSTRPIDRLRYQAKLVFDHFDQDGDGRLELHQLQSYVKYSSERFGEQPELAQLYSPVLEKATVTPGPSVHFEQFCDLVRAQVKAMSSNRTWLNDQIKGNELGRLLYKSCLTPAEMISALVVFKLLDFNNDTYVRVDELQKAQGIEKRVFDEVLQDADTNQDGFLTFEDFLTSYHKERPVFLSFAVMAAHAGCFWFLLNSPLDPMFKALIGAALVMKPQLVTSPAIQVYNIFKALFDRGRASFELFDGKQ